MEGGGLVFRLALGALEPERERARESRVVVVVVVADLEPATESAIRTVFGVPKNSFELCNEWRGLNENFRLNLDIRQLYAQTPSIDSADGCSLILFLFYVCSYVSLF